jgi:proline dehydrogenase
MSCREKSSMSFHPSEMGYQKQSTTNKEKELEIPDFNDAQSSFESKSTASLLRASLVYTLCGIKPLVNHAEPLLKLTRQVFGDYITDSILKATLYGHFCCGEDEKRLEPAIAELRQSGIGGILDYAAESDGGEPSSLHQKKQQKLYTTTPTEFINQPAREYSYESEAACDRHVEVFRSCIRAVANVSPDGFAAIKVTALGNPLLLERMSSAIVEIKNLFAKFDENGNGFVSREEFEKGYR